ncbi:MAG: NAD(P)H-dependent oxidoreductase subunit E [Myxococcales bacterium]|nr:NAD(P)H-dependent oxidoreductase subunit E [Myxococcales bacterium]
MNLLQELIELQAERGFLPEATLEEFCQTRRIPRAKVEELCSFYPHLRRSEPAPHRVAVCRDLACYMRGGADALESLRSRCAARGDVEFEAVSCLGRCDNAPACSVDDVPMNASQALEALAHESIESQAEPASTATWRCDPYAGTDANPPYDLLRRTLAAPDASSQLIETLSQSDLRGMGGAGFPTGRKWGLVADQPATPRYVICNADESEPGTFKDRVLLHDVPHLVIEGMVLAGLAIDSHEAWIYIRHEYEPELGRVRQALDEARRLGALGENIFGSGFDFDIQVFVSPGGYILGEETALLEALEGRRGEPRNKPPYPGVEGLYGKPTLINNVETFALVPHVIETGRADLKFFSISGDVAQPGVFEVDVGTTLRELVDLAGGMADGDELLAFQPGGASTGFLSAEHIDIPMTFEALREVGSALGSGAVIAIREGRDLVELAGNLTAFFRNESCGKCVPCRIGTEKAVKLIQIGDETALASIPALHEVLQETSICGLGQAALNSISSVLENFPSSLAAGHKPS